MLNTEREIGFDEGLEQGRKEIVLKLKEKGYALEEIMDITGLSEEEIDNYI